MVLNPHDVIQHEILHIDARSDFDEIRRVSDVTVETNKIFLKTYLVTILGEQGTLSNAFR